MRRIFAILVAAIVAAGGAAAGRVSLDKGWTFTLEGEAPRVVDVPHDWSVEYAPYAKAPTEFGGGFYRAGKATYEREFVLAEEDTAAGMPPPRLVFEGVYRDAEVFVNDAPGVKGSWYGYTGFTVPLEGKVHAGTNKVRVVVDNSAQPNCRWYSGSGILRHVWLERNACGACTEETENTETRRNGEEKSPCLCGLQNLRVGAAGQMPKIEWSAETGLTIDGVPTLLHGACVHHDHGPLGAASYDGAELRKVRQLKAAGFNAVRCSHNPASEAFLDACDAEGLWVVQELCDGWREKKNKHDYGEVFERDWEKDLRWMVERDKHHPSIVAWSIGNEILERTSPWAAEQAERMVKVVKECDPSRPVTEALCSWHGTKEWQAEDAMAAKLDIVGYNYMEGETERDHERCPRRVIVYTETYPKDAAATWRRITKHPYVIGEFVWTGIDYLGESTIGRTFYEGKEPRGEHYQVANRGFPWHGAYCGDIDLVGHRKPISHLRETLWNENAPTYICANEPDGWRGKIKTTLWSVWPQHEHWNFAGWEGKPVTVEVYTREPHVALFLNGRKIGEADVSAETAWTAKFEVPYEPGVVEARTSDKGGAASVALRTAGEPVDVRYTVERFGELEYVTAEIVDAAGNVCPYSDREIEFDGDVIATCSADLRDTVVATSRTRRTFQGRALAIRKARAAKSETVALLDGWSFKKEGDEAWQSVTIPHDWAIAGPFAKEIDAQVVAIKENGETKPTEKTGRSGSLPWIGKGTYRRTVEIPEGAGYASLVFEAAMSEPEVFWDGVKVGEWKYGYNVFEVEVPAVAGCHELEVRLQNLPESSRWYPGAGLIRPVKLVTGPRAGIATFGVYVRTPTLQTWEADVELRNPDNLPLAVTNCVKEGPGPYKSWSPEEPNLYTLVTEVRGADGGLVDSRETRFGFRTLEFGPDGFKLNGAPRKFQGVCLHHDLGPIGAAYNDSAFRRQIEKLKWLGCDAIRTSHNMPCPEQIALCDELGMMVMAESFDMWKSPKCKNGYCRFYDDWWRRDLEMLVKVNRSSPSVVMWSIGNEISEQSSERGARMSREMQEFVHSLDATRPVTQGLNHWPGAGRSGTAAAMDILGMNYRLPFYDYAHTLAKDGIVLGSETASSFSSRGCYHFPVKEIRSREWYHPDGQCSSYDVECAAWANLPDDDHALQEDKPWTVGEFVWTGFDYLGEPSPYDTYWPSRSSYFGIYDLAGLPKDRAWLYRSYWNRTGRTLHVLPHWTWPGREGQVTPVEVYTDAPKAELFVNGKSQGVREKDKSQRLERFRLWWREVAYEPGEVKVVAFYPDGTTLEETVRTAGEPAAIRIDCEAKDASVAAPLPGKMPELAFFEVSIVDKDGTVCPDAALDLEFEVSGTAKFRGVCNGDATSLEVFTEPKMRTFHGKLVVVAEPVAPGEATLTVRAKRVPLSATAAFTVR